MNSSFNAPFFKSHLLSRHISEVVQDGKEGYDRDGEDGLCGQNRVRKVVSGPQTLPEIELDLIRSSG